jgi:hypothetical protein
LRRPVWTAGAKGSGARAFLSIAFGYLGKALLEVVVPLHVVLCAAQRCALKNSIRGAILAFSRETPVVLQQTMRYVAARGLKRI